MGKNEKTPIDINGKPYYFEDMTDAQKAMVNHIADLDRKIGQAKFNLDQLNVGREAFGQMLVDSLAPQESQTVEEPTTQAE
jgi:hypothetical protein